MNNNDVVIRLDQVSSRRIQGSQAVITKVSLSIRAGEWVCIAGPNGAGKSTLVKLLNGLIPASEGTIEIEGAALDANSLWSIREKVGMVFANPENQFVGLSVEDDLAFGLENKQINREDMRNRIAKYARLLRVEEWLNRHPAALSGGQKQRVGIASVLAMEPSIIVFDEAVSMLDERSKLDVLELMREMKESGRYTIISITHDVEEMMMADRLIVMSAGEIAADGQPDELLREDDLLRLCRLQAPYALQLCRALRQRGIDIGESIHEEEVLKALWAYHSNK